MPSEEEVAFIMRVLRDVVEPSLVALETLGSSDEDPDSKDNYFANELCRHCTVLRYALAATAPLALLPDPDKPGQQVTDVGDECVHRSTFLITELRSCIFTVG
jgi:hypothetical protein